MSSSAVRPLSQNFPISLRAEFQTEAFCPLRFLLKRVQDVQSFRKLRDIEHAKRTRRTNTQLIRASVNVGIGLKSFGSIP